MNENIIVMLALGVWVGVNEVLWAGFRAIIFLNTTPRKSGLMNYAFQLFKECVSLWSDG